MSSPSLSQLPTSPARSTVRRTGWRRLSVRDPRRAWRVLVLVGLLVTFWALLAPTFLGGDVSYVVTDGISMLPRYHADDLVLLRTQRSYHVGEVAGYHNGQLGVVVMHRIVALDGSRYVFKGDNNSFTDTYEPTKAQIVGAEWLHLARWGRGLKDVRSPVVAATLLGAVWLLSFRAKPGSRRRRRRHAHAR